MLKLMKSLSGYSAPAGAEAVYAYLWHLAARVVRVTWAVIVVMVVLGWVFALLSPPEEGKWLFQLITIPFIYVIVVARRLYDTEPVFASRDGIYLLRNGAWQMVSWSRVGEAKPLWGFNLFLVILIMPVEGEPRPVRFIARRKHREILERLRSGS